MSNVDVSNPLGAGGDHEKGALESKDLCMHVLGWGGLVGFGCGFGFVCLSWYHG